MQDIRGSCTFSILASINKEVPHDSFLLGTCVLRSSHSPIICRSRSPPPTLKNWVLRSFPEEIFILHLTKFTLPHRFYCHFLLHCRRGSSSDRRVTQVCNSFFGFHSRCFTRQKGVSHLLHAQHQPLASTFSPELCIPEEFVLFLEGVTTRIGSSRNKRVWRR